MTRDQDLERQLADWLVDGPTSAPSEVVDHALKQTEGRRQWHGASRPLALPLAHLWRWFPGYRAARVSALAAVLAGILITSVVVSVPFSGGDAGPTPTMEAEAPLEVTGTATATMDGVSDTPTGLVRWVDIKSDEPLVAGRARQELSVLVQNASVARLHGTMRLETDRGAWEGPVDVVRYPSGEEYEYASLRGSDAYDGFTYEYLVHQATAEAERTVEGAIWPDELPPLLDPSVLP